MKYIEELTLGDTFSYKDNIFVLTSDFKSNGSKLCYSLVNGSASWFAGQTIVEHSPIYVLDKENNTIPVKATIKTNHVLA
jgi:hypothetical protein